VNRMTKQGGTNFAFEGNEWKQWWWVELCEAASSIEANLDCKISLLPFLLWMYESTISITIEV
jgi:hypothetical protein